MVLAILVACEYEIDGICLLPVLHRLTNSIGGEGPQHHENMSV